MLHMRLSGFERIFSLSCGPYQLDRRPERSRDRQPSYLIGKCRWMGVCPIRPIIDQAEWLRDRLEFITAGPLTGLGGN
jgi:hypothetical protein